MKDIEKLRVMLPHWIQHNSSHVEEFKRWSEIIKEAGEADIADLLSRAIAGLAEADKALTEALEKLGGAPPENAEGRHHHHH